MTERRIVPLLTSTSVFEFGCCTFVDCIQTNMTLRNNRYYKSFHWQKLAPKPSNKMWMVMNLAERGSALDALTYRLNHKESKVGHYDDATIATILHGALSGLAYLHHDGMMHRDVKAANILLGANGNVMLADFGISTWIKQDPLSSKEAVSKQEALAKKRGRPGKHLSEAATANRQTLVGTPCWMAPEVMLSGLGEKKEGQGYDQAADIWSLGITAIELATGSAPYQSLEHLDAMVRCCVVVFWFVFIVYLFLLPPSLDVTLTGASKYGSSSFLFFFFCSFSRRFKGEDFG